METVSLIRNTKLEELALAYKKNEEIDPYSDKNIKRKNHIAAQVYAAFKLLRELGKPNSPMTLKEFETAHAAIKQGAKEEVDRLRDTLAKVSRWRIIKRSCLKDEIYYKDFLSKNGYKEEFGNKPSLNWLSSNYSIQELDSLVEQIFQIRCDAKSNEVQIETRMVEY